MADLIETKCFVFLTYEFGPLCRGPEQRVLLGEGMWAPVTCKDQDVGSRALGCTFGPIEWSQRPGKSEAKLQKDNEQLLQPTAGQVL